MKNLLNYVLMLAIGGAAFGVAYSTHERMIEHMREDFQHRSDESRDEAWNEALKLGKHLAYEDVIAHARIGTPCKIKLFENSDYTVTINVEEVEG